MVRKILHILPVILMFFILQGCEKDDYQGDPWANLPNRPSTGDSDEEDGDGGTTGVKVLEAADNTVVAHRGGSTEVGENFYPDNSIAALRYAIGLGCFASEADIYWTKDNNVIVAHADSQCKINGVHPWEYDIDYIRLLGRLTNGENIPTLEEYITVIINESKCTRLWLDIKNITYPETLTDIASKACTRACEIIEKMNAQGLVEFICTGNSTVMKNSFQACQQYGIPIAWMSNSAATTYRANGYPWANLSITYMNDGFNGGARTIKEFNDARVELSVFNVDDEAQMNYYVGQKEKLKAICTNYPKKLIGKMR